MATAKGKRSPPSPRHPEHKYGPFHGGVGVAIWLNEVQTTEGLRYFRSVTIAPRRYRDPETGEWRDASSLRSSDLPALILALQAAHQFMSSTQLPGESVEEDQIEDTPHAENGIVPF